MRVRNVKCLLILVLFATALLAVTGAEAAKGGKPDKPDKPGYEPEGTITPVYVDAAFTGLISETLPILSDPPERICGCGGPVDNNPQGWYRYVCHGVFPWGNLVYVDLTGLDYVADRGATYDPLCERLKVDTSDSPYDGELVFNIWPDSTSYGFYGFESGSRAYAFSMDPTWNDGPCIPEADGSDPTNPDVCSLRITTQGYFDECAGNKCGRLITLTAWGHPKPYPKDPVTGYEFNSFLQYQDIGIEELTVTFRGIRRDKKDASCTYTFEDTEPNPSPIRFETIPDFEVSCLPQ